MRKKNFLLYVMIKTPIAVLTILSISFITVMLLLNYVRVPVYYVDTVQVDGNEIKVTIEKQKEWSVDQTSNALFYTDSADDTSRLEIIEVSESSAEYFIVLSSEKKITNENVTIEIEVSSEKLLSRLIEG